MAQPTIVVTQNGNPLLTARGPVTFGSRALQFPDFITKGFDFLLK